VIGPPTVLVVGAGALVPYELPSGRRLLEDAINLTREIVRELPPLLGVEPEHVQTFLERLHTAECDSIDAMLERHEYDEHLQRAGRGVIAYCLAPYLRRTTMTAPGEDWIKFVWQKMADAAPTFQTLRKNRLHIVTFNFDKVIEAKLTKAITALYGTASDAEVTEYVDMTVLHLNGAIEAPPKGPLTEEWIGAAVQDIRVVREPAADLTTNLVTGLIEAAHVVCCLGFGHHRDNISRLGFPGLRAGQAHFQTIHSTAIGIPAGQLPDIERAYGPGWTVTFGEADESCLAYLQNRDVLQG
jgi:hypothetical protein